MLHIHIAEGCAPTGSLLRGLLTERGIVCTAGSGGAGSDAIMCWGNGYTGRLPSLNRNAARFNKLEQLQTLASVQGVRTVPALHGTQLTHAPNFPVFMRKLSHAGGVDIRLALEPQQAQLYLQNGWNYATKYTPHSQEFRVWMYRKKHLGTYEKHLARPTEFLQSRRFGANFDNGYAFRLVPSENLSAPAIAMAAAAVDGLGLDFGAVDMILGRDGNFYVLEVNTAPGVEGPDRQVIQALADKIAYWVNHNYPRRTGDEAAYERPTRPGRGPDSLGATAPLSRSTATPPIDEGVSVPRPSFLPRPTETFAQWQTRVNS